MKEKSDREAVLRYAEDTYGTTPEYLWKRTPNYAVLRNQANRKWYGAIIDIPRKTLGLTGEGIVDILDIKCSPVMIGSLLEQEGYLPAYHMNKNNWITVLLDGTVPLEGILPLVDLSYQLTEPKLRKAKGSGAWRMGNTRERNKNRRSEQRRRPGGFAPQIYLQSRPCSSK